MLTEPWRVSIAEIDAILDGKPLPPSPSCDVAPHYACMAFMERWIAAMDRALGVRCVDDVPEAEWVALASRAEVDALSALPVSRMARC